ncbi:MAG: hypothetical protein NTV63_03410, partial [Candidatus Woesearchaeota archaeon]|nr:hypothetical protein [Candidatus Woesearchaeota archaeon]
MKTKIFNKVFCLFILVIMFSSAVQATGNLFSFYFVLHKNNQIDVIKFEVAQGQPTNFLEMIPGHPNNYTLILVSFFNKTLYEAAFNTDFEAHPYPANPGDIIEDVILENISKAIRIPYFEDAEKLNIYHNGNLIYTLYIRDYLCKKDGICSLY